MVLVSILVLGFSLATDLVSWFPQLAGLYASMGLPVNVVGLEFEDAKTLTLLRDGKIVMQISARIRSISSRPVPVPPVLVSLLDAQGRRALPMDRRPPTPRKWTPARSSISPLKMNSPPDGAVTVRLSFTTPGGTVRRTNKGS